MDFKEYFSEAQKELMMADHMANITLPVIKDHKVFINILTHLNNATIAAMRAMLQHGYEKKRLRIIPSSEILARQMFFEEYANPLGITTSERMIVKEMRAVVNAHRSSQMEFKRGAEYVLILPDYRSVTVNENNVKRYLSVVKSFIGKIERGLNG